LNDTKKSDTGKKKSVTMDRTGLRLEQLLLNIGFGNTVPADRVVAILTPNSSPMKRLKDEARDDNRLIDATHGRKTRAIIVTNSNHVILSAIQAETVSARYEALAIKDAEKAQED
jgi:regulator of extracellular matrix RemA (YlzA/DUF370 family)